jgi:hypothetical protein
MPAARPATMSRSSSPTYTQRAGATPSRRAASSSGAGCGLAWGVVSPHTTVPPCKQRHGPRQRLGKAHADLLVTTPQGSPATTSAATSSAHHQTDIGQLHHAAARSSRKTLAQGRVVGVVGRHAKRNAQHAARPGRPWAVALQRPATAGRGRYASCRRRRPGRVRCRSGCHPGQTARGNVADDGWFQACSGLLRGKQVVDAGVGVSQ